LPWFAAFAWRPEAVVVAAPAWSLAGAAFWSLVLALEVLLLGGAWAAALEVSVLLGACALALDWALLLMSLEVVAGWEVVWPLAAGAAALAEEEVSVELVLVEVEGAALLVDGLVLLALISGLALPAAGAVVLLAVGLEPAAVAELSGVEVPVVFGEVLEADWFIDMSLEVLAEAGAIVPEFPVLPVVLLQWSAIIVTELTWKVLPELLALAVLVPALLELLAVLPLAGWPESCTWWPTWFWSWSVLPVSW
jgi:hypothetical protein